jgi:diguanylate cyclase (GGDEF)-like protein/PAS domain S-box-containing protein
MQTFMVASATAIFLGLMAWSEVSSWNAQISRMNSYLVQTAKAIEQHTDDVIEVAKQPLAGLVFQAQKDSKSVLQCLELMRTMREMAKKSPYLRSLAYIGADGRLIESTTATLSSGTDLSGRSYFKFHKNSPDRNAYIDGPFNGPLNSPAANQWYITLSQRVNDDRGHFAGVMLVTVNVDQFINFFNGFNILGDGAFAMINGAGRLLVRAPLDQQAMGTSIAETPFYKDALSKRDQGDYQYRSPFDGAQKTSGYYKSPTTQITSLVAVSTSAIWWRWIDTAKTRWLCALMAIVAAVVMGFRLRNQWILRARDSVIIAAREAEFRLIANASSDLIEKLDDNGIREYVSAASQSVLDRAADELVGSSVMEGYDTAARQYWSEALANMAAGSPIERLVFRRKKDSGEMAWLETVITRVRSLDVGGGMVAVTRDVTSQRLLQEELDWLANTDELTQLSNKRHFNAQMKLRSAEAIKTGTPLSLLLLDADRFKLFNDTYGHLPGDHCLRMIATEISASIRPGVDLAARYGGEEIAILLPGLSQDQALSMAGTIRKRIAALKIDHAKNLPWGHVTVSIGVATLIHEPHEGEDALFIRADQALYKAKGSGRNTVIISQGNFDVSDSAVSRTA